MPFGFSGKGAAMPGSPPKALPDPVGAAQRSVPCALALAGVGEAVAVPAQEIAPRSVEFGDAPPAGDAIHHAGTDEIRPCSAEATGYADDADGLGHVLPLAATDAHAIGEVQSIVLGAQIDRGDLFAVASPLPAAHPAGAQAAFAVQAVNVDRPAGFHSASS